jgi:hypothetical protein
VKGNWSAGSAYTISISVLSTATLDNCLWELGQFNHYSDKAMGWTTGVQFLASAVKGLFLFNTASRMAQRPNQLPTQWVSRGISLGVKWLMHETDHSHRSSAMVKNA